VPEWGNRAILTVFLCSFLMRHLRRVADKEGNRMDANNLATVFSPNLVHSETRARRPESLIGEMEMNAVVVKHLIQHACDIFP